MDHMKCCKNGLLKGFKKGPLKCCMDRLEGTAL